MLPDIERLIELQQVDLRLQELTRQTELFPQQRAEVERQLSDARRHVETARQQHTETLKQHKKLELDVQQLEERISKHKSQLYEVKTNEAYRALQEEITHDEKAKSEAEDRVLEAMLGAEDLVKEIKAAEAELKQVEQRVAAELKRLDGEQRARDQETTEQQARRESLRAAIGEEALYAYDRISGNLGGIALAEARDELCLVCRVKIRPQTFTEVKRNDQIRFCESCHRILYYLPPARTVDAAAELA